MIISVRSSLTSLEAIGKKLGVTADNIANYESEGFKKNRALIMEGQKGDVVLDIQKVVSPGPVVTDNVDGKPVERELSNVDLAEEIPQTISLQRGHEANIKVIETQEETLGSLLDIIG